MNDKELAEKVKVLKVMVGVWAAFFALQICINVAQPDRANKVFLVLDALALIFYMVCLHRAPRPNEEKK